MKEEDIKSYSLRVLEEMIEDALGAECRPDEIFNTIKLAAKRNANYHRICARDAQSLVDLLEGVDRTEKVVSINSGIKIDDFDRERFKLDSDYLSDYTNATSSYNDGWTQQHYRDKLAKTDNVTGIFEYPDDIEHSDAWYDYTRNDPDAKNPFIEEERNNEDDPKTYDEMVEAGYTMTGDGFWIPDTKRIEELKEKAGELDGA